MKLKNYSIDRRKKAMNRSGIKVMGKLIGLVKPLLHIMILAIFMGVLGFLCSIFITILGGFGLVNIFRNKYFFVFKNNFS